MWLQNILIISASEINISNNEEISGFFVLFSYRIHDIIISGPTNISKHRSTHDEFVIRWTPTPDDLGDHFPICFAVESVT